MVCGKAERAKAYRMAEIMDRGSWIMDHGPCILHPGSCILHPALSTLPWLDVHPERRKQARCARRFESFRKTRVWSCRAYVGGGAGMMMAVHCISMRALGPREEDQRAGRLCRKRRSKGQGSLARLPRPLQQRPWRRTPAPLQPFRYVD